jgi:excisionase family DNA binding protein
MHSPSLSSRRQFLARMPVFAAVAAIMPAATPLTSPPTVATTAAPAQANGHSPAPVQPAPLQPIMTTKEACAYLRIHRDTLDKLHKAGHIKRVKFGRAIRYKPSELQRYVDRKNR